MSLSVMGLVSIDELDFLDGKKYVGGGGLATAWISSLWSVSTTLYSINCNLYCNKIIENNISVNEPFFFHKRNFSEHDTTQFFITLNNYDNEFVFNASHFPNTVNELELFLSIDKNDKYIKLPASNFYFLKNSNRNFSVNPQGQFDLNKYCSIVNTDGYIFLNKKELLCSSKMTFFSALKMIETIPQSFVITLGRDGAICYQCTQKQWWYCPSIYSYDFITTLGCGDAFAGGFMSAHTKRLPIPQCLVQGTFSAYSVMQSAGNMVTKWFDNQSLEYMKCLYKYVKCFDNSKEVYGYLLNNKGLQIQLDLSFDKKTNYDWMYH